MLVLHKESRDQLKDKKEELIRQIAAKEADIRAMLKTKEELEGEIKVKDETIKHLDGSLTKKRKHCERSIWTNWEV